MERYEEKYLQRFVGAQQRHDIHNVMIGGASVYIDAAKWDAILYHALVVVAPERAEVSK